MSTFATPAEARVATRPTWAEVSLSRLRHNFRAVERHVGNVVTVCAVVKADAYGHGAIECSRALEQEGASWLGVTSLDEAIPLREAGIGTRILLMTGFWRGEEAEIVRLRLTPTVWEAGQIESLNRAATVPGFPIHLKVDTGMGRLGAAIEDLPAICKVLKTSSHLVLEGISTAPRLFRSAGCPFGAAATTAVRPSANAAQGIGIRSSTGSCRQYRRCHSAIRSSVQYGPARHRALRISFAI